MASKLSENEDFEIGTVGDHGLSVTSRGKDRLTVVAEPIPEPFGLDELDAILSAYQGCEAIILIRRCPDVEVVETARARGVLVDTFGNVTGALASRGPMRDFQNRDEAYLRSRLQRSRYVSDVVRVGFGAWRVERSGLRDLVIITSARYEFPVDDLHELLGQNPNLEPDAVVVTNPYANGLSKRVVDAAVQAGMEIYLLNDFFGRLARQ